jgi:hypothetical protein
VRLTLQRVRVTRAAFVGCGDKQLRCVGVRGGERGVGKGQPGLGRHGDWRHRGFPCYWGCSTGAELAPMRCANYCTAAFPFANHDPETHMQLNPDPRRLVSRLVGPLKIRGLSNAELVLTATSPSISSEA